MWAKSGAIPRPINLAAKRTGERKAGNPQFHCKALARPQNGVNVAVGSKDDIAG
jgi:hypothetical protein